MATTSSASSVQVPWWVVLSWYFTSVISTVLLVVIAVVTFRGLNANQNTARITDEVVIELRRLNAQIDSATSRALLRDSILERYRR